MTGSWGKIITHTDFDGVVSAAICSYCLGVNDLVFAGPTTINRNLIPVSGRDVVCDLPYPLECGLWFDHHPGNLEELRLRGFDPARVPGRFGLMDSCSRVVLDHFSPRVELPDFFETTVLEADVIDAFKYRDIEDWRKETLGKIVDCALRMAGLAKEGDLLRRRAVFLLRDHPLEVVAANPEIMKPYEDYKGQEERMLAILQEASYFLPDDQGHEMVVVDLTRYKKRPSVSKNLAFLLYPASQAVVEIRSLYDRGIKTNDLGISISLSPNVDSVTVQKDLGGMMRGLNIGDGHKGAAGGKIRCGSKDEMVRRKGELLGKVLALWQATRP